MSLNIPFLVVYLETAQALIYYTVSLLFHSFHDNYKIDLENEVKIPVWFGKKKTVKAVLEKDVLLTLKTEDKDKIKLKVSYSSPIEAPVKKGDALGILSISYPDGSNSKHILVAESGVNRLGYFGRMKETVKQWIKKMGVSK